MFGMLSIIKRGHHKLANIIKLGADLIKKFMLLGSLLKIVKAFEVGIKDRAVINSGEWNVDLDTSAPLVNATFHLQRYE
jgi:hypothetical protein